MKAVKLGTWASDEKEFENGRQEHVYVATWCSIQYLFVLAHIPHSLLSLFVLQHLNWSAIFVPMAPPPCF